MIGVKRASLAELDEAYAIVSEYFEAIRVVLREDLAAFAHYFEDGSGLWLARQGEEIVGCVGLRPLASIAGAAEVKRMYVKPDFRRQGFAARLLNAVHVYACQWRYAWCYLDSKAGLDAAIRFYERSGYEHCERYNENPEATVFMRKKLSA